MRGIIHIQIIDTKQNGKYYLKDYCIECDDVNAKSIEFANEDSGLKAIDKNNRYFTLKCDYDNIYQEYLKQCRT